MKKAWQENYRRILSDIIYKNRRDRVIFLFKNYPPEIGGDFSEYHFLALQISDHNGELSISYSYDDDRTAEAVLNSSIFSNGKVEEINISEFDDSIGGLLGYKLKPNWEFEEDTEQELSEDKSSKNSNSSEIPLLNDQNTQLSYKGRTLAVNPDNQEIIAYRFLLENRGKLVPYDDLFEITKITHKTGLNKEIHGVVGLIRKLFKKLKVSKKEQREIIKTTPDKGYILRA